VGLNPEEETIADLLKQRGYATAIFGKWHLGSQHEFLPCQQGFDEYFGLPYSNDMWPVDFDGVPIEQKPESKHQWLRIFDPLPLIEGNQKIDNINLKDCFKTFNDSNDQNEFSRYDNYMNVSVLGVSEYISKMDWFLVVEIDESEVFESVGNMQNILTIILSVAGAIVLIFSVFYSKSITKPIEKLELYANQISNGNLDIRPDIKTSDEIGNLAKSFTQMATNLKKYNEKLETEVEKRTEELQKKIDELEKFKKVTVGRELRMAELKKEIKKLETNKNKGSGNHVT